MSDKEKSKSSETDLSLKNAASKLDISETIIKKYIKDFELPVTKGPWNKALISLETFQALLEIVKLRANGLTIAEIKELKTQEPSKHVIDEVEETPILKVEEVKPLVEESPIIAEPTEIPTIEDLSSGEEDLSASESSSLKEITEDAESTTNTENSEDSENQDQDQNQKRRRGFNYRYVERQISSDSKRVSSIRVRLKNPNLSVQDRMFFEEALERRILFLNGWKHILKWIAKS